MNETKNNFLSRFIARIDFAVASFSITERIIFYCLLAVFVIASINAIWNTNNSLLVAVPETGGTLTEGIIGVPRFVNPVIASSDVDRDMASLVYSGLMSFTPAGDAVPDLAESWTISEDKRTYSFKIRGDAVFHDSKTVTAEDVEFTIEKIQDPAIKSPRRAAWEGVVITKNSDQEISFTLRQPYAPFVENLNVGILPKHLWQNVPTEDFAFNNLNINPIGSGPYKIKGVRRDSLGVPIYYELAAFKNYTSGRPFVSTMVIRFYSNERNLVDAYKSGRIDSFSGVSPVYASEVDLETSQVIRIPLSRVFGIFFNQNQASVFIDKEVRLALDMAIDKEKIINEVLGGFGRVANDPAPTFSYDSDTSTETTASAEISNAVSENNQKNYRDKAIEILSNGGWVLNTETGVMEKKTKTSTTELAFSISTGDAPELKRAAEIIQENWRAIGADVSLQIFETNDLNQNVIRPRKYDALFFGEVIGRDYDLYPFWHSSQRNDPGLNIALYTNISADKILETIRGESDRTTREKSLSELISIIKKDQPASFVYSPDFIYVLPKKLFGEKTEKIINASDRFIGVSKWYIDTNRIWKIFNQ